MRRSVRRDRPFPLEFAVVVEPDYGAEEWSRVVRASEDLGYDALLVTDHLHLRLAAMPALAMAAALTSRIRLVTYVLNCDLRNPAEVATRYTLSGGRSVAGLGAGWMRDADERAGETQLGWVLSGAAGREAPPRLLSYLIGTAGQIAQEVLARRERWGFSLITVPAWAAAEFAPVMRLLDGCRRLAGTGDSASRGFVPDDGPGRTELPA